MSRRKTPCRRRKPDGRVRHLAEAFDKGYDERFGHGLRLIVSGMERSLPGAR